ncbi:MAG: hypothetical protein SOV20_08845 [Coriobacteriales bacterium]|nr:hypothetical protein [Coriobacteriales bacterium]
MDLTFTDEDWNDVALLTPKSGDFAWGVDENDFSIDVYGDALPPIGGLLYLEGSDVGGIVRGYDSKSDMGTFSVTGDTWTGVLDRRVLKPPSGSAYRTVSGDARDCLAEIVSVLGLGKLFYVQSGKVGVTISHTFTGSTDSTQQDAGRYMGGWAAIWQMLSANGLSCAFAWDDSRRMVRMRVGVAATRTDDESKNAGLASLSVSISKPVNHLICLGKGELAGRTVLDLYADASGAVSTTQTITGVDEIADVYDDSGAEDTTKLEADGRKKLKELYSQSQEITISAASGMTLALGDIVGGTDKKSGMSATATVTKRVLSFTSGIPSFTYTTTVRS